MCGDKMILTLKSETLFAITLHKYSMFGMHPIVIQVNRAKKLP